jgi:hypothetical protein
MRKEPRILMKKDEEEMFVSAVLGVVFYFEWGAGGSTFRACKNGAGKVVSVESQKMWIEEVKQYEAVKIHPDITFHHIDINAGNMGRPENNNKKDNFPTYSAVIDKYDDIDVVLVDGRFRLACACKAVINGVQSILIHDFTSRTHYHDILPYVEIVSQTGTLVEVRPKEGLDIDALNALYESAKYDYR